MAQNLARSEITYDRNVAVPGYKFPLRTVGQFEETIAATHGANIVSWLSPGRSIISDDPIADADATNPYRLWTERNTTVTRAIDAGVLGGLPRWVATGQAVDGLAGSLPAALSNYSFAFVWQNNSVGTHRIIFGVGTNTSDHLIIYHNSAGNGLNVQHTNGNTVQTGDIGLAQDEWIAGLVSYRDSDGAIEIFANSATPALQDTLGVSPPNSTDAYALTGPNDYLSAHGELAIGVLWDTPLHTHSGAVADVMGALGGIAAL